MRIATLLFCLVALTRCDEKGPTAPSLPLDQRVALARGQAGVVSGSATRLQFVDVTSDSRCPADALCIQAGEAVVQLRTIDNGATEDYELRTGDPNRAAVTRRGLRIELVDLQPHPFSGRPIAPGDYRATIIVSRP